MRKSPNYLIHSSVFIILLFLFDEVTSQLCTQYLNQTNNLVINGNFQQHSCTFQTYWYGSSSNYHN